MVRMSACAIIYDDGADIHDTEELMGLVCG
jgi:hypothetical protein